jgi:hypothetical protein
MGNTVIPELTRCIFLRLQALAFRILFFASGIESSKNSGTPLLYQSE